MKLLRGIYDLAPDVRFLLHSTTASLTSYHLCQASNMPSIASLIRLFSIGNLFANTRPPSQTERAIDLQHAVSSESHELSLADAMWKHCPLAIMIKPANGSIVSSPFDLVVSLTLPCTSIYVSLDREIIFKEDGPLSEPCSTLTWSETVDRPLTPGEHTIQLVSECPFKPDDPLYERCGTNGLEYMNMPSYFILYVAETTKCHTPHILTLKAGREHSGETYAVIHGTYPEVDGAGGDVIIPTVDGKVVDADRYDVAKAASGEFALILRGLAVGEHTVGIASGADEEIRLEADNTLVIMIE